MKVFPRISIFAFETLVLGVASVLACGCGEEANKSLNEKVNEVFNRSTAVFSAKVSRFEYREGIFNAFSDGFRDSTGRPISYKTKLVRLETESVWKGDVSDLILLVTDETLNSDDTYSISSCDFGFLEGESYVVFASVDRRSGFLRTVRCGLTAELEDSADTLKVLGKGSSPINSKR